MKVEVGQTISWPLPPRWGDWMFNRRLVFTVTPAMLAEVLKGRKRRAKRRNP